MSENNRNPIEKCRKKLSQFTTMNVIDGQANLVIYASLIFYSLTIDNILNIMVLLILAGVLIAMLTGDNGILENAKESKLSTTFSTYKEEVDLYKTNKYAENMNFLENTLEASKTSLLYNTIKRDEKGNIKDAITTINDDDIEKFEIINGKLLINTKDVNEIKVAQSLGIEVNPCDITEEGELQSSDGNLLLVDETGTLKIPNTVTKIGEGAFANVSGLKTIIIPKTVKEIGKKAFSNNETLEKVIIEDGVEKIGNQAFYYCLSLETINIPPKVENILKYTFTGNYNLSTVILNEGLKSIEEYAFSGANFSEISIPSTVTKIENQVFAGNKNLRNIIITNNSNFIYENGMLMTGNREILLFISNDYLENITTFSIPKGVKKFDTSISSYTNINKIVIPETLEEFTKETSNLIFPTTIEVIEVSEKNPKFSVSNKDKILYTKDTKELIMCFSKEKNITIDPNNEIGILKLNKWSFAQASNAEIITLPNSLTTIDAQVFDFNKKLQELKIGENVSDINPIFKYRNYSGKVKIDSNNSYYIVENDILYNKSKSKLISVLYEINGEFNINNKVKEIGNYAFHGQSKMTSVNILSNVERIGGAFNYCTFTEIEIPESVQYISNTCFELNPNLDKIIIHKKENSILGAPWGAVKGMRTIEWR